MFMYDNQAYGRRLNAPSWHDEVYSP